MSHSLNEIEALAKRAARGTGLSWGQSEETGKATRWLASHRLPGVAVLASVLAQNDGLSHKEVAPSSLQGMWEAPSGTLCPLAAGMALNDCADRVGLGQTIEMARVSHPLLVVPFAAWAAMHINAPVSVNWPGVRIETDGYGLWIDTPRDIMGETAPVSMSFRRAEPREDPANKPELRGEIDKEAWQQLNAFAHRTYAPATEESRLLGAGAGVSDND
jgi:hypothetical protein